MIMGSNKFLRTALQRTYISMKEWARSNNIYDAIYPLNMELWGFVYRSNFGNYLIVINQNLTLELQKEVYCHEVDHIMYDMPEQGYIIGIDMQYSQLEQKKDCFARQKQNFL